MFSSGCLAKNKNTHLGRRRVREREETEVTAFILALLITDPVTRYFVQQATMFLKSTLSCQMVAITQWKGLSLGGSRVRHVWAVEGPQEPSIWTCCGRLLEVALKMGRRPSEPLAIRTDLCWEARSWRLGCQAVLRLLSPPVGWEFRPCGRLEMSLPQCCHLL